jgi:N utilization substance protein B
MGFRRKSRELAMQALFYFDARGSSRERMTLFCRARRPSGEVKPFFLRLVKGVLAVRQDLDAVIERFSSNWRLSRMSAVDRNVLRIGAFELLYCRDIPAKVAINEAIEIGKKFGTEESGAFINGILDSIHLAVEEGSVAMREEIPPDTDPWPAPSAEAYPAGAAVGSPGTPPPRRPQLKRISEGVRKRQAAGDKPTPVTGEHTDNNHAEGGMS